MAVGDISYYVLKPWITPDELFHRVVAEFVQSGHAASQRTSARLSSLHPSTADVRTR